jgi:hypothetical protein
MPVSKQILFNARCCLNDLNIFAWRKFKFHFSGIVRAFKKRKQKNNMSPEQEQNLIDYYRSKENIIHE